MFNCFCKIEYLSISSSDLCSPLSQVLSEPVILVFPSETVIRNKKAQKVELKLKSGFNSASYLVF